MYNAHANDLDVNQNDKPIQIHTKLRRNRNRRVNSRGNGRTIKGYDNQNAVFATHTVL